MRRQILALKVIALLVVLVVPAAVPLQVAAAGADGSLVLTALDVLRDEYVRPINPVHLLNEAIFALRQATGLGIDVLPGIPAGSSRDRAVSRFLEAFAKAVRAGTVKEEELSYTAVREMLASLQDSHVYYLDPVEFHERSQQLAGKAGYEGIGVFIRVIQDEGGVNQVFVTDVFAESPAAAAGLKKFDRITEIDSTALAADVKSTDIIRRLRGPGGTAVTLTIQRGGQTMTVPIVRAPIRLPPVEAQLIRPGVAYVRLVAFSLGLGVQVRQALRALQSQGEIHAVILDLRSNAGGFLNEAEGVAGVFLPPQTMLVRVFPRTKPPTVLASAGTPLFPEETLEVLTDGGTASAAEVVVAGLRNAHRATIIGERTAGSEGAAATVPLAAGGMLVTVGRILGPHYEQIDGVGITPDVQVVLTATDAQQGLDTQLEAALKALGAMSRVYLLAA